MSPEPRPLAPAAAVGGLLASATVLSVVANAFGPAAGLVRGLVGLMALGAIVLGLRWHRPPGLAAWVAIAVGLAMWVAGDALWDWFAWRGADSAAWYWADVLYLGAYPALAVGIVLLVRARSRADSRAGLIDGSILALAAVILVWALLVAPQRGSGSLTDDLLLAAYPLGDGLLLAGIAWLALTPGRRCASLWALGGSLSLIFVADLAWNLASRFEQSWDSYLNPLYPIGYALLAAAALHPSVRVLTEPVTTPVRRIHPARLVFLGVALFVGPLVAVLDDGELGARDLMVTGCSLAVAGFVVWRFVALVHDNEHAHLATATSERRFRLLAENCPVGIYEIGHDLTITYANAESEALFGRRIVGDRATDLLGAVEEGDEQRIVPAANAVLHGERAETELRIRSVDGVTRWVSWHGVPIPERGDGLPVAFASTLDITPLKHAQEQLARQATHDVLTDLPNRALLFARLRTALDQMASGAGTGTIAVMFIDLDRFKLVNDVLGHDAGDSLLIEIAARLRAAVRPQDVVARFGGDEFVVMLEHVPGRDWVTGVARRIMRIVQAPVVLGDTTMDVGASIGVAIASGRADDPEALVRDADVAMYRAKEAGRGRFELFDTPGDPAPAGSG